MTPLSLSQGSPAWHAARAKHFCASEAPAMLGVSKYMTRSELLALKKTGITAEVDAAKQRLFDAGHESEAKTRPIAEGILGQDLFPMVGVREVDGLPLLASFDGLTMDETIVWETKLWNEELAMACASGELDPHYWAQLEHQLIVSQADIALFTTSDGTPERTGQTWYSSVPDRRKQVIDGWKQFAQDLATYVPEVTEAKPVGRTPETLPALHIEVTGMVTASNLAAYKEHALAVFAGINRELVTDQHFADAEKVVKWCGDVEDRLEAAKQHALSQTASIDQLFKAIDDISAEARRTRLELDKLVKGRKEALRVEIVTEGARALAEHLDALDHRIGKLYMPAVPADFAGAIKGKRLLESIRDAVNTTLANAKIAANAIADRIQINLKALSELEADYSELFPDVAQLVLKDGYDLTELINGRIASHKLKEARRAQIAEEEKRRQEVKAHLDLEAAEIKRMADLNSTPIVEAPKVVQMPVRTAPAAAPAPTTPPSLKLGQIAERLGFALTADFLRGLGFEPAATDKSSKLFHERDFTLICAALVNHINQVQASQAA